ncbi:Upc2 protein [Colletotrichum graminicola]|nr:Upc2 protein [Colletotrichum graminicola]
MGTFVCADDDPTSTPLPAMCLENALGAPCLIYALFGLAARQAPSCRPAPLYSSTTPAGTSLTTGASPCFSSPLSSTIACLATPPSPTAATSTPSSTSSTGTSVFSAASASSRGTRGASSSRSGAKDSLDFLEAASRPASSAMPFGTRVVTGFIDVLKLRPSPGALVTLAFYAVTPALVPSLFCRRGPLYIPVHRRPLG